MFDEYEDAPFYREDEHGELPPILRKLWGTLTYTIANKYFMSRNGHEPNSEDELVAFLNYAVPEYYEYDGVDGWEEEYYDFG
jgi:hypothetical protein